MLNKSLLTFAVAMAIASSAFAAPIKQDGSVADLKALDQMTVVKQNPKIGSLLQRDDAGIHVGDIKPNVLSGVIGRRDDSLITVGDIKPNVLSGVIERRDIAFNMDDFKPSTLSSTIERRDSPLVTVGDIKPNVLSGVIGRRDDSLITVDDIEPNVLSAVNGRRDDSLITVGDIKPNVLSAVIGRRDVSIGNIEPSILSASFGDDGALGIVASLANGQIVQKRDEAVKIGTVGGNVLSFVKGKEPEGEVNEMLQNTVVDVNDFVQRPFAVSN